MSKRRWCLAGAALLCGMMASPVSAQKQGGVLRVFHRDSPASMSILEEGSISAIMPMMGVFNNLVLFDHELVGLIEALHGLAHNADRRADYLADRVAYAERFGLTAEQHAALVALDHNAIVAMGTHPLLPFLARMQVDRAGRS